MSRHSNAFNLLRLLAALGVLVSHNFPLLGLREPHTATGHSLGAIGVLVFFSISGFLVAQSLSRSSSLTSFALKRVLRIYPGLIVALTFCALVLGPLLTTYPIDRYLTSETTWRSIVRFFGFTGEDRLPGVFEGNPYPNKVNAPLWTIKYELVCYAILWTVGAFGLFFGLGRAGRSGIYLTLFVLGFATLLAASAHGLSAGQLLGHLGGIPVSASVEYFVDSIASFSTAFFLGALLAESGSTIALNRSIVVLSVVALAASLFYQNVAPLVPVSVCFLSLWAALAIPLRLAQLTMGEDWSYGVYIYAFPVQQTIVAIWGASLGYWGTLGIALATSLAFAAISWRLVESPALRLKGLLDRRTGRLAAQRRAANG